MTSASHIEWSKAEIVNISQEAKMKKNYSIFFLELQQFEKPIGLTFLILASLDD